MIDAPWLDWPLEMKGPGLSPEGRPARSATTLASSSGHVACVVQNGSTAFRQQGRLLFTSFGVRSSDGGHLRSHIVHPTHLGKFMRLEAS